MLWLVIQALLCQDLLGHGIFRNGQDAQSMGLAGIEVPDAGTPLSAMHGNPAGLSFQEHNAIQGSLAVGWLEGDFSNAVNTNSPLNTGQGFIPALALRYQPEGSQVSFGFSAAPQAALLADWRYNDAPGGLGGTTSYGVQQNRSKFVVVRFAGGVAWQPMEWLAVGASVGLAYNDSQLTAPYTFQNAPGITGAKTLLDLKTTGFGVNGNIGVMARPLDWLQLGATYQTPTRMSTSGQADGNAFAQFNALGIGGSPLFTYKTKIQTCLPQVVSLGAKVTPVKRVSLLFQAEWVDYANAFDDLRIDLSNGTNPTLNTLTGGSAFTEVSPLDWRSVWVFRVGAEVELLDSLQWRVGYSYGENPVPTRTITPLTAAINEQTVGTGLVYTAERYQIALAYQYDLKNTVFTGTSNTILNGEYQNSSISLDGHWVGASVSWFF